MSKLNSILKNVPLDLMWKLRKYHTRNGHHQIKWKAREPVDGAKYGWGGNLKWKDAKSADLYAYDRTGKQKRWEYYQELKDTKENYERLYKEYVERLKEYEELDDRYQSILSLYRTLHSKTHNKGKVIRMWRQWHPISWMLQKIVDFLLLILAKGKSK